MFNYNPSPNRVGDLLQNSAAVSADITAQGSKALSRGIEQGSAGIADALQELNQYHQQVSQAQGALRMAKGFEDSPVIDSNGNPQLDSNGQPVMNRGLPAGFSDNLLQQPGWQQIGAVRSLSPMINSVSMMNYRNGMLGVKQQNADTFAARHQGGDSDLMPVQ